MKVIKSIKINKEIRTYEVHPSLPDVKIKATFEKGKLKEAVYEGKGPHGSYGLFVKPEFWEMIKRISPWWEIKHNWGWDGMVIEAKEMVLSQIQNPEFQPDPSNFVWVYNGGHMLFDTNGDPIPVPYGFDYISSPFSNEYCALKPLLEHLKGHSWIINKDELYIDEVPYYNNEGGWRKYIRGKEIPWICVLPEKEAYKEMYLRAVEKDKQFFSSRVKELMCSDASYNWPTTKEKDYLGIRQFYKPFTPERDCD